LACWIVPPQSYFQVVEKWGYSGGFAEFYTTHYLAFTGQFCRNGRCLILPTWNHLWFVVYLFLYTATLALVLIVAPALLRVVERRLAPLLSGAGLLILPVLLLAAYRLMLYPSFPQTNALVGDWYNHALYGTAFLFGYLFALDEGIVAATSACAGRHWQVRCSAMRLLSFGGRCARTAYRPLKPSLSAAASSMRLSNGAAPSPSSASVEFG
jgi:hypothetical protein